MNLKKEVLKKLGQSAAVGASVGKSVSEGAKLFAKNTPGLPRTGGISSLVRNVSTKHKQNKMINKGVQQVAHARIMELAPHEKSIGRVEQIYKEERDKVKNKLKGMGSY